MLEALIEAAPDLRDTIHLSSVDEIFLPAGMVTMIATCSLTGLVPMTSGSRALHRENLQLEEQSKSA